jgi:hypothetical protein
MKTLKHKAWCLIEAADNLKEIPTLYKNRKKCIEANTSYYGHDCDSPERRGLICECEVIVKIKGKFQPSDSLKEYYRDIIGTRPPLLVVGDDSWNKGATARHEKSIKAKLKQIKRTRRAIG